MESTNPTCALEIRVKALTLKFRCNSLDALETIGPVSLGEIYVYMCVYVHSIISYMYISSSKEKIVIILIIVDY